MNLVFFITSFALAAIHETGTAANLLCDESEGLLFVIECGLPRALLGLDAVSWYPLPHLVFCLDLTSSL
jgi:hypothetical protein